MSLDDISVIVGRLLIAIVVVGVLYLAVHTFAPGWLNNTISNALNSVSTVAFAHRLPGLRLAVGHPTGRVLPRLRAA